mgnify:CR=1 FL=1
MSYIGWSTIVSVSKALYHGLMKLKQVISNQFLYEIRRNQTTSPIQQLTIKESILQNKLNT